MPTIAYDEDKQRFINTVDGSIATHKEIKEHYNYLWKIHTNGGQTCTPKEWDTCRVEKMGCRGCYYDVPRTKLLNELPPHNMYLPDDVKINKQYGSEIKIPDIANIKTCLHCSSGEPLYCENCYQELLNEVTTLNMAVGTTFPKNTVLEFMDALRNIIISGEKDNLKLNKIMQTIIFYERDLK